MTSQRDHGGGLDAACAQYGGTRADWIDLSTGINPDPYPMPPVSMDAWTALPDAAALDQLVQNARRFWNVPDAAAVLAAPGASALIAQIPYLRPAATVSIPAPTYNEHAASFRMAGWAVLDHPAQAEASVIVHPNNPDGAYFAAPDSLLTIIDESFCDIAPEKSLMHAAHRPGTLILKSFGKFWGLAGLRLGFAIGDPALIAALKDRLGPWSVAGPALTIGAEALADITWANATRARLAKDAETLDAMVEGAGAKRVGGTSLFRLYDTAHAARWQAELAKHHIWTRIFPYSETWLRIGLPPASGWSRLQTALADLRSTQHQRPTTEPISQP